MLIIFILKRKSVSEKFYSLQCASQQEYVQCRYVRSWLASNFHQKLSHCCRCVIAKDFVKNIFILFKVFMFECRMCQQVFGDIEMV